VDLDVLLVGGYWTLSLHSPILTRSSGTTNCNG